MPNMERHRYPNIGRAAPTRPEGNNRPRGTRGKEVLTAGHASGGVLLLLGQFLWLCAHAALSYQTEIIM